LFVNTPYDILSRFDISGAPNYTSAAITLPNIINQWNSIIYPKNVGGTKELIFIGSYQSRSENNYTFSAFWMYQNGSFSTIGTSETDSTFVNFFWADFNSCAGEGGQIYVLAGDENSLITLDVKLFTFDIATSTVTSVLVDNSVYTISSIHVNGCSPYLYALSPGKVDEKESNRVWSIIQIDPTTGKIVEAFPVTTKGLYSKYYGGSIYGSPFTSTGQMLHLFQRQNDNTFDILAINIDDGSIAFQTSLNFGISGFLSISNPVFVAYA